MVLADYAHLTFALVKPKQYLILLWFARDEKWLWKVKFQVHVSLIEACQVPSKIKIPPIAFILGYQNCYLECLTHLLNLLSVRLCDSGLIELVVMCLKVCLPDTDNHLIRDYIRLQKLFLKRVSTTEISKPSLLANEAKRRIEADLDISSSWDVLDPGYRSVLYMLNFNRFEDHIILLCLLFTADQNDQTLKLFFIVWQSYF